METGTKSRRGFKKHLRNAGNQRIENTRRSDQQRLWRYYKGQTERDTSDYFDPKTLVEVPVSNNNITKRVINRISMVNMVPPVRTLVTEDNEPHDRQGDYKRVTKMKSQKMKRAERYCNLFELTAVHLRWIPPESPDEEGFFMYQVIYDFEPEFDPNDPFTPIAVNYPIAIVDTDKDALTKRWQRWDSTTWIEYDMRNNQRAVVGGGVHGWNTVPFIFMYSDGMPESGFMDVTGALDLIDMNENINVMDTNLNVNIHFQSFGYIYFTGLKRGEDVLFGANIAATLPDNATAGILHPPNTVDSVTNANQAKYKAVAQNYGLDPSFVEGQTAASGVALKVRQQELTDNRKDDVTRCRDAEQQLYEKERLILQVEKPEWSLPEQLNVDFGESIEVLTPDEQMKRDEHELKHGQITRGAILQRKNPDMFKDIKGGKTALEQYEEQVRLNLRSNKKQGGRLEELLDVAAGAE